MHKNGRRIAAVLSLAALLGCSAPGPGASRPGTSSGSEPAVGPAKIITVAVLRAHESYGPWDLGNPTGGGESLFTIHTGELTSNDLRGGLEARVAAQLPSVNDGTIAFLPDGRMQTVWRLRPNVKWHDGAPLTADDVAFSWQVTVHPEIPGRPSTQARYIQAIETPDPRTVVMTWRSAFYDVHSMSHREFPLLPRHLLHEPLERDKEAFVNLPYWTTGYVHAGPFRQVDYQPGERLVYERFDHYFLGRPRADRIIVRIIPDENAVLANLLGGAIDIAAERTMPTHLFATLAEDWKRSGEGIVVSRQENWRFLVIQFHPEWSAPSELSRDVRVRRGLLYGLDRDSIRAFAHPGFPETGANSFLPANDARSTIVGQPFARYAYDPGRAARELAEVGWRRAADGRLLNRQGEPVQIELRGGRTDREVGAIVAHQWRDLGLDVSEHLITPALQTDREYRAKFPGLEFRTNTPGPEAMYVVDSRQAPTLQNRFLGLNSGSYHHPELDHLIDRLYASPDARDQAALMKEIAEILASDLPLLTLYFRVQQAGVRKGVRALADDYAGAAMSRGALARNSHLWDRE